ncbi:MAG: hypothetical protein CL859_06990 [Cyanobium sp. ARS6]|nr:hypothetical protein [Cyanobium sp. ARS6]
MTRATRLIKKLDRLLSEHDSFGDSPESCVDEMVDKLSDLIKAIQEKNKQEHWASIYVERDRTRIKTAVLNKVMDRSSQ